MEITTDQIDDCGVPTHRNGGGSIVTIGCAATFDYILRVPVLPDAEVPLASVPMIPSDLHKVYFGGCAFNVAVAASICGVKPFVISPVGKDFAAHGYPAHLVDRGVEISGIIQLDVPSSSCAFLLHADDGAQYCIGYTYSPEVLQQISLEPLIDIIKKGQSCVITPNPVPFVLQLASVARDQGIPTVIVGPTLSGAYLDPYIALLKDASITILNRAEYQLMCRALDLPAYNLGGLSQRAIFVTDGAKGSYVVDRAGTQFVPCAKPSRFLDPSGAGDAYAGGVVAALAMGKTPLEAARIGSIMASFVVEEVGCQTSRPSMAAFEQRYAETYGENLG